MENLNTQQILTRLHSYDVVSTADGFRLAQRNIVPPLTRNELATFFVDSVIYFPQEELG